MRVDAGDHADVVADASSEEAAEDRPGDLRGGEEGGGSADVEDQRRAAVLRPVQPVVGRVADDGAGDVEKIAVAVGARAEHRVAEDDRVGLAPGDIAAQRRPVPGLVGRAGPALLAAELAIRLHHAPRHAARRLFQPDPRAPHQVERADIERRAHRDRRAPRDQPLGEQRAGIAMVERAVDMRRGDRDQPRRAEQARAVGDDAHRHRRAGAVAAGRDRAVRRTAPPSGHLLAHRDRGRPVEARMRGAPGLAEAEPGEGGVVARSVRRGSAARGRCAEARARPRPPPSLARCPCMPGSTASLPR